MKLNMFLKVFMNHLVKVVVSNQSILCCNVPLYLAVDIQSADSKEPIPAKK